MASCKKLVSRKDPVRNFSFLSFLYVYTLKFLTYRPLVCANKYFQGIAYNEATKETRNVF